jgi:membrane protein DedA with SNARE-associated domain
MLWAIWTRLVTLIEQIGYQGIAFAMFLENIFPPIPSELIMPFAGFLAGQEKMSLVGVILAWVIGTYIGVLPFYLIGYRLHKPKLLRRTDRRWGYLGISTAEIEKAFAAFEKRGNSFVLFGRFIPLFRTIISFPAGAVRMNFWTYSGYTIVGTAIWCTLLATVGYVLGDQWERVSIVMKEYEHIMLAIIALGVVVYFWHKIQKKIRKRTIK